MKIILYYIATLIPLAALDAMWLLVISKGFYAKHMEFLFTKSVNMIPVLFFYPIYSLGILFLVVLPAVNSGSWIEALWRGALLGLVAYSAYDLTNHATISGWPTIVTFVDILWGVAVTALVGVAAYFIILMFK